MLFADHHFRNQRRLVLGLSGLFFVTFVALVLVSWRWTSSGSAQVVVPGVAPTAAVQSMPYDAEARIEEISRSQDRFVEAILGIVGVMGTVFAVLLGLNIVQSNKNFERETAATQAYARAIADDAVDEAGERLKEIADARYETLKGYLSNEYERHSGELKGIGDKTVEKVIGISEAAAARANEYIERFSNLLVWSARQELRRFNDETDPQRKRWYASSLLDIGLILFDLGKLLERNGQTAVWNHSLGILLQALGNLQTPQDTAYWKSQRGRDARTRLAAIAKDAERFSTHEPAARRLASLIPAPPD